jgi:hypothetical protein
MSGAADFDFLHGWWTVRHRRLKERGVGCSEWQEFTGAAETRPLLHGSCNVEEHSIPGRDVAGVALRTFSRSSQLWSIYWVGQRTGELENPVIGSFEGGVGIFEGEVCDEGRSIRVKFLWQHPSQDAAQWQQSFSYDDGDTWEVNWTMDFQRA